MPFTYTNRKGITYTLYRKTGVDGKSRHVFGRNVAGEPVDVMPPGFRVSESPNGVVSVARDRPALIRPEEIAAVEAEMQRHERAADYRLVVKQKRIEIYAKIGTIGSNEFREILAEDPIPPDKAADMQELEDLWAEFVPVAHITLRDPERRTFAAEQRVSRWDGDVWVAMGTPGTIGTLAREVVPELPMVSYVYVPPVMEPFLGGPSPGKRAARGRKRSTAEPSSIHQLKVTLLGIRPPIWRRIAVPSAMTLGELHAVLQLAMGWTDSHLHDFRIGRTTYGDPEMLEELGDEDEWEAPLDQVAPQTKSRIRYLYDFGDSWEHEILVEKVGPPDPETRYPVCLAGKRAGPPDDCGGVWGYVQLLETLADPRHPEHEWMMEWAGGPIDPEAFDLDEINRRLGRLPS